MTEHSENSQSCCGRGGKRPGCGRKPGVKTRPVRLPEWLLDALEEVGDPRKSIVKACMEQYGIQRPANKDRHE
ncbi:hypothetical protein [Reinekea marinisedimentorum]|nr:hypothetical protein [Reinekea marinisedimentorum]